MKYPIGIETATVGYVYVDTINYLHTLITSGSCYFLSRPRRFGKIFSSNTRGIPEWIVE